jgi:hypothetical protein
MAAQTLPKTHATSIAFLGTFLLPHPAPPLLRRLFNRLLDPIQKMALATTTLDDAALDKQLPDLAIRLQHAVAGPADADHAHEPDADAALHVPFHRIGQDLGTRAVEAGHAVHVEDDAAVLLRGADARQRGVRGRRAVGFEPREPGPQAARVGEEERFGDFDDEDSGDELERVHGGPSARGGWGVGAVEVLD